MQKQNINILCNIKFKHDYTEKQNIYNICDQKNQINDILPPQKNGRKKYARKFLNVY